VGDWWRGVEERVGRSLEGVIFVQANNGNAAAVAMSAALLWPTDKQVGGMVVFDVGRDCES